MRMTSFQSRMCLKRCIKFCSQNGQKQIFYDQERPENYQNYRMSKGWVWLSAGKPDRIIVAAAAASCGVLMKSFFEKNEQHV